MTCAGAEGLDFIRECLQFNPDGRPSCQGRVFKYLLIYIWCANVLFIDCVWYTALLRHVYVAEFHNEDEEPVYPHGPLRLPIDDNTKLTAQQYRDRLYEEITNRRKESRLKEQQKQKGQLSMGMPV